MPRLLDTYYFFEKMDIRGKNEKDSPSRRVFIPKKLYLMKKIITFL